MKKFIFCLFFLLIFSVPGFSFAGFEEKRCFLSSEQKERSLTERIGNKFYSFSEKMVDSFHYLDEKAKKNIPGYNWFRLQPGYIQVSAVVGLVTCTFLGYKSLSTNSKFPDVYDVLNHDDLAGDGFIGVDPGDFGSSADGARVDMRSMPRLNEPNLSGGREIEAVDEVGEVDDVEVVESEDPEQLIQMLRMFYERYMRELGMDQELFQEEIGNWMVRAQAQVGNFDNYQLVAVIDGLERLGAANRPELPGFLDAWFPRAQAQVGNFNHNQLAFVIDNLRRLGAANRPELPTFLAAWFPRAQAQIGNFNRHQLAAVIEWLGRLGAANHPELPAFLAAWFPRAQAQVGNFNHNQLVAVIDGLGRLGAANRPELPAFLDDWFPRAQAQVGNFNHNQLVAVIDGLGRLGAVDRPELPEFLGAWLSLVLAQVSDFTNENFDHIAQGLINLAPSVEDPDDLRVVIRLIERGSHFVEAEEIFNEAFDRGRFGNTVQQEVMDEILIANEDSEDSEDSEDDQSEDDQAELKQTLGDAKRDLKYLMANARWEVRVL